MYNDIQNDPTYFFSIIGRIVIELVYYAMYDNN